MPNINSPPFSVGETGRMGSPGRREIGHGALAQRALDAVMPEEEVFPYTVRIVSDITESNGSFSLATVCGGKPPLLGGGGPVKAPVAGGGVGRGVGEEKDGILTHTAGDRGSAA